MSFWDNLQTKLSDPSFQAQLQGFLNGAVQAAQPTRVPLGFGAALGMMGQGALQGKLQGIPAYQMQQNQLTESNLGVQEKLGQINYFRQLSGLPPIGADGKPTQTAPQQRAPMGPPAPAMPQAPPDMATMINSQLPGGAPAPSPPMPPSAPQAQSQLLPPGVNAQQLGLLGMGNPKAGFDILTKALEPYNLAPNASRMVGNQTIAQAPPAPPQPTPPMSPPRFQQAQQLAQAQADAVAGRQLLSPEVEAQRVRIAAAEAKARADAMNVAYDPDTIRTMAEQALAGDTSVFTGLGYGGAGQKNRAALRDAVTKLARERYGEGAGGQLAALNAEFFGLKAGERTLGTRTANIEMAVTEAQQLAPLALQASAAVNRTQFPTLNSFLLAADRGTGGENVVRLSQAVNSLINVYARAISPSGVPTVSDKDHAREILSSAWSKGQFAAGVDQMMKEMNAARQSPGMVRGEFRNAISGGAGGSAMVPDAPSSNAPPISGGGNAPLTAVGPNGQRIQWNGSAWVPVK